MICKKQWYQLLCSRVCSLTKIPSKKTRSCSHSKNKNSQHRLTGQLYATRLCSDYKTLSHGRLLSHSTLVMPDIKNNQRKSPSHSYHIFRCNKRHENSADSTINLQLPFLYSCPTPTHQTNFLFWVGNKLYGWVCLVLKSTTTRTSVTRNDEVARW